MVRITELFKKKKKKANHKITYFCILQLLHFPSTHVLSFLGSGGADPVAYAM